MTAKVTNAKQIQKLFPTFPKITNGDVVNILKNEKKNKTHVLEFAQCSTAKLCGCQIAINSDDFKKYFKI